ncbi:MAG TPA: VOC family protein [Kofleriaceae bacterium]|jgi:predicted 3-demethylubiquinone-9 3-methyltransferase (glyoxalase superfamily)|nr:VOC family protein [Kofleriaceae bacterium]
MSRITTFLMLDAEVEVVAKHYTSIFKNSKIVSGTPTVIELDGFRLFLYNGGEYFKDKLGEGMSLFVSCETQAEVDYYWEKLLEGGKPSQCGWLKDKFGVSWQIVPTVLSKLLTDKDPARANRAMQAMLKMVKLDIAELERAANG